MTDDSATYRKLANYIAKLDLGEHGREEWGSATAKLA
jgi:hypothetical protein